MRIIGGSFKGRKFYPPADKWPTRPTTDYSKEGLFNILTNRYDFEEWKVLDLFGGTLPLLNAAGIQTDILWRITRSQC